MNPSKSVVTIRATLSSYVVLSGIWFVLSAGYLWLHFFKPGPGAMEVALLTGGIAILWCCWLLGFKLSRSESALVYRDGLYRTHRIPLADVKGCRFTWKERKVLTRSLQTPVLVITTKQGGPTMVVNPKPFSREGLHEILDPLVKTPVDSLKRPK
jgi:hypothetical protein